jgi:acyl-CoA reductase-like NAD-dependent aldehyde dehydrogenase
MSSVESALCLAREAFNNWSVNDVNARLDALARVSERLSRLRDHLIKTIHRETAKPTDWCEAEVDFCISSFAACRPEFETAFRSEFFKDATGISEIRFRPLGVVVVFSPFNSPLECLQLGLLPALAAGNAVVIKTSDVAKEAVHIFASAFQAELGQVVQVVDGDGSVGAALVAGDIEMVVFTGSEETGRKIAEEAGRGLKRVVLELGGKDPFIVLKDVELTDVVHSAVTAAFAFAGQVCTAGEQVWIERPIYDSFLSQVVAQAKDMAASGGVRLISPSASRRVRSLIADAVSKGARLECGGDVAIDDENRLSPAVLTGVDGSMRVAREEIFGPVMCLHSFAHESEVIAAMKDARYALGASVYGKDIERARRLAEKLPNAVVGINRGGIGVQGTPWLGARSSGLGFLGSIEGHRQFSSRQVITT